MAEVRVALVTGSSSGIGLATVKLLAQKGYQVVVVGSNPAKVEAAAKICKEASSQNLDPLKLVLDFKDPDNAVKAVEETVKHFNRIDVLVNNAGIFCRTSGADPKTYDKYREAMSINTDSTVKCTLAAVQHLERSKGNIIFMSSVASVKPSESGYAYCMTKAAMSTFARCLAIDLAPNVRVNIVSPGPVLTPIFNSIGLQEFQVEAMVKDTVLSGRIGRADEVANAIAYLISDEASFVNGHELFIDGGYLLKGSPISKERVMMASASQAQ